MSTSKIPATPTNLVGTPFNQYVLITFKQPIISGVSAVTNYQYSLNGGNTFTSLSPAKNTNPLIISGLTNGTNYPIAIRAVNTAGVSQTSSIVNVIPRTTPGVPTNLVGTPLNQSVSISFTEPNNGGSEITNYQYSLDGGKTLIAVSPVTTTSPIIISGLTNGTTYPIALRAVNIAGTSITSPIINVIPRTIPGTPTNLVGTPLNQSVSIAFTPPSNNGGSAITKYQYSLDGGNIFTDVSPVKTTSPITISGLTNGTSYPIALRAVNIAGESQSSSIINVIPRTTPNAPTNLIGTSLNQSVSISFTPPSNNGGSAITNYQYSFDGGKTFTNVSLLQTNNSITITGLINGNTYFVSLRAVNLAGGGQSSSTISVLPGIPTNIVTTSSNQTVSVSFTPPINNGGGTLLNYQYSLDGGNIFTDVSPPQTTSPIVISDLTNGTNYSIALRAVYAFKTSDTYSVTPYTIPDAPTNLVGTPLNQSVSISFTEPNNGGSAITKYQYSLDGGNIFTDVSSVTITSPITISGLTNGTSYPIVLRAVNIAGPGVKSVIYSLIPSALPGPPTNIKVTPLDQSVSIAFTPPSNNGGSNIINYQYSLDDGDTVTVVSTQQTTSPIVISDLTNGITYSVTLQSVNIAGPSVSSEIYSFTPISIPGAPTDLVATNITRERFELSFTEPYNGGSDIINYEFSFDNGNTFIPLDPPQTNSPITFIDFGNSSFNPQAIYNFYMIIKAVNEFGAGEQSQRLYIILPKPRNIAN